MQTLPQTIMKITWTKCSERMPPDSLVDRFIFTNLYHACAESLIYTGHTVNMLGIIDGDAWTPYTDEKWEELSR